MIIPLMNKTGIVFWTVFFLSCMFNLKSVCSKALVHSNYKGKYSADIKNYEIVFPQRVNKDGSFISHLVSHHHSKRSTKELEIIFYKIPIEGEDYLIELTPNLNLVSPGAVLEIHRDDVTFAKRTSFNENSNHEKIGKIFRNLDVRKLENTECHFLGHVKGENISKAALSTCNGLAGFIQIMKGFYTIEPVAERDPFVEGAYPHILYKTDGLGNSSICHAIGELKAALADQVVRKRRDSNLGLSLPFYIETLIVMDKALINHHRDSDCENYVLTVFNMAFNLFHDASSGLMMMLTIVRIIRLEVENDEMNLKVNADAEKTLRYFQTWQYEINPGDDSHPNHHDIAILITRVDICYSPSACGLLGLTIIGKACDPKLSAALCQDDGLRLGYIIAHEIGHLLGADHDSENSTCNGFDEDGLTTIMHPSISLTAETWSACSQACFKAYFGSGMGSCFLDQPEEHHFNVQDMLPGVMYNADFQCRHLISINAQECDIGSTCDSLNCYVPGYACIITHAPPADGTRCGENMWCHDTKCLVVGERPGAVDGNWGEWSPWGDCSRTCGSGVASSERNCDKPQPSHGGKNCVGERKRYKICAAAVISPVNNISGLAKFRYGQYNSFKKFDMISEEVNVSFVGKPCETGRPSFRDIQCGEFDDWIYPEDGKIHTWKAYFFHDDNPCVLYCINEKKDVAALKPRVVDGTMCFRGIRDICVAGICKSIPCDLHFESNAIEDACGICHGDGTGCEFSEGVETFSRLAKGFTKLVTIPAGTRNIKVEETSPTLASIIVRDLDSKDTYVRGTLGMFNVPGSVAWLGMIKKNQEALNIPGPVTKSLAVWIQRRENVTVKWSMALPAEQQRKGEFAWDFLKWGPCSSVCGPGTQISEPSCMEGKAGLVEDSFCADLEMPPAKVRQCEVTKCESRWMVGDWRGCESASQKKQRKRIVYCIKPVGEGEGESQIVSDSECTEPKPHDMEICENRQKREDADYKVGREFFETESTFKSDTSEFGFHKKYEDYLKHFAALPVPQRNSETIPLYLVSSPHFKHYFHVLETPEDSENSGSGTYKSVPRGTSRDAQTQDKVSPDFYKETFSGQQIGVSHIQSASQYASDTLENRKKKSVKLGHVLQQGAHDVDNFYLTLKHLYKKNRKHLGSKPEKNPRNRIPYRRSRGCLMRESRNVKCNFRRWKNYKRNVDPKPLNNSNVLEGPSFLARTNVRDGPKKTSGETKLLLGGRDKFFSKNGTKWRSETGKSVGVEPGMLSLTKEKTQDGSRSGISWKSRREEKSRIERFAIAPKFFFSCPSSRRGLKEGHPNVELSSRRADKNRRHAQKRTVKSVLWHPLRKRKRSSRKWKKPKSKDGNIKPGKEQSGTVCGAETRNYLNNLFREGHPSMPNKLTDLKHAWDKVVIKEGLLVVDKDLAEDQEVDLFFDGDKEKRQKYGHLPQPARNERKLKVTGQDVFDLFQALQRPKQEGNSTCNKSQESFEIDEQKILPENGENLAEKPSDTIAGTDTFLKSERFQKQPETNKSTRKVVPTTPKPNASPAKPGQKDLGDATHTEETLTRVNTGMARQAGVGISTRPVEWISFGRRTAVSKLQLKRSTLAVLQVNNNPFQRLITSHVTQILGARNEIQSCAKSAQKRSPQ